MTDRNPIIAVPIMRHVSTGLLFSYRPFRDSARIGNINLNQNISASQFAYEHGEHHIL